MPRKLFIFGIGYVGCHLAEELLRDGWHVAGTCRSPSKKEELAERGIATTLFDGTHPAAQWQTVAADATHILISVPPKENVDPVFKHHARDIVALKPQWIGYLSTTGVYGDHGGAWVDETAETRTTSPRGTARLAAEKMWLSLSPQAHIFRLAGIYGPGRSAIDNLYQGTARNIVKDDHVFSRIHVADIVQALQASMQIPRPGRIYNIADDAPSASSDVVEYAAKIIGLAAPPRIEAATATLSETAKEFYENNKRIKNDRLKTELGVHLKYPTYREGLRGILARRSASSQS